MTTHGNVLSLFSAKHMINQKLKVTKAVRKNRRDASRADRRAVGEADRRDVGQIERPLDDLTVLTQALKSEVWEREILNEQLNFIKDEEKVARHAAFHDPLTGLPNRALFNDRLQHGLELAKRHDRILAVMFLDLDAFKAINDTYGHDAGDNVLLTLSKRFKRNTRSDDTVCRYGGDEFLFLLMEVKNKQAVALIAENLMKIIQKSYIVSNCDSIIRLNITASIGISMYPQDGETADDLIKSADNAMYIAKQTKSSFSFALQVIE